MARSVQFIHIGRFYAVTALSEASLKRQVNKPSGELFTVCLLLTVRCLGDECEGEEVSSVRAHHLSNVMSHPGHRISLKSSTAPVPGSR